MPHISEMLEETGEKVTDVAKGAVAGFVAGLVASWVMEQFQAHKPPSPPERAPRGKRQEQQEQTRPQRGEGGGEALRVKEASEGEEPATVKAAEAISQRYFHHDLSESEKVVADPVMHYAMGGVSGMVYGVAAELTPLATTGFGLLFGAAVWFIADEATLPALGLSKMPTQYPPSTHADALGAHLCYGITTDIVRRVVRAVL